MSESNTIGRARGMGVTKRWVVALGALGAGAMMLAATPVARADTDFRIGIGIDLGGHRHHPAPVERVDRVWVEPVYRTVHERVWVPPVTRTVEERVWVHDRVEEREVVRYRGGRRCVEIERVVVEPGHFETRCREVEVAPGHWATVTRQELVREGYWQEVRRPAIRVSSRWDKGDHRWHDHDDRHRWGRDRDDDDDRHDWRGSRYQRASRR